MDISNEGEEDDGEGSSDLVFRHLLVVVVSEWGVSEERDEMRKRALEGSVPALARADRSEGGLRGHSQTVRKTWDCRQ